MSIVATPFIAGNGCARAGVSFAPGVKLAFVIHSHGYIDRGLMAARLAEREFADALRPDLSADRLLPATLTRLQAALVALNGDEDDPDLSLTVEAAAAYVDEATGRVFVAWSGRIRGALFRGGQVTAANVPHTVRTQFEADGRASSMAAADLTRLEGFMTRALGSADQPWQPTLATWTMQPGDVIVFTTHWDDDRIAEAVRQFAHSSGREFGDLALSPDSMQTAGFRLSRRP